MISQYESGLRKPSAETVLRIAEALECNISDIVPDMCYHDSTGFYFFFDFDEEGNTLKSARKVTSGIEPKKYFERLAQKRACGKSNDVLKGADSKKRIQLLQFFDELNSVGQAEAVKRVEELSEIEKYKKK